MIGPQVDLFGVPLPAASAFRKDGRRRRKIGYAARPGTGPKSQRCQTCQHFTKVTRQGYPEAFKCALMAHLWTHSSVSDIQPRAPACDLWARRPLPPRKVE